MNTPTPRPQALSLWALTALAASTLSASAGSYTNDFSSGVTGLTIYTISGAPPEVRSTDGDPGGYLKLTDAVGSTTSTVIFPDFDNGFPVQGFTFDVDCRIGNGSATPADGFCIAFARTGDPVITTGAGFVNGGAEEGTTTGLAIGFDTYNNGGADQIGFTVRLDGNILLEAPAATLNGELNDPTSLQTGPIGNVGWAHFKVVLGIDGKLDVFWKGAKVVDALDTGWTPSGGRMVFAARTGGANEEHHFDNLAITTTPATVAAVTTAKANDAGYHFEITDFGATSVVTPAGVQSLSIDGSTVIPTSVTKAGNVTTVTYVPPAGSAVLNRSAHTYELDFVDQTSLALSGSGPLNAPTFPSGPLLAATPLANRWNVREVRDGAISPQDIGQAAVMLAHGTTITDGTAPFINFSDPFNSGDRGMFKLDTPFLSDTANAEDDNIVQGANISVHITGTTPAELQRTFWVQSDDAFALRAVGAKFINKTGGGVIDPADDAALIFPLGTSNSNTRGLVQFPSAGDYVLEFIYAEFGGGAFNEVAWANGDFVNNPDASNWTLVGGSGASAILAGALPATPTGAPLGQWNVREIRNAAGGVSDSLSSAAAYAAANVFTGATVSDGVRPVINFNDLDGGKGASGLFNNDIGLIGNQTGDDDHYILAGRATIPVPAAGDYTLEGIADDGFAVKIVTPGGRFLSTGGPGGIDPLDSSTFYNPAYSDTPTVAAAHFDNPGNYDVVWLSQEGTGGSSGELAFAPGRFTTIGGTGAWQLLGDTTAVTPPTPFLPNPLPGPDGAAGLWGIRFIRKVQNGPGDNVYNALAAATNTGTNGAVLTDGTTPYLNFSNLGNGEVNAGLFSSTSPGNGGNAVVADMDFLGSTGPDDEMVVVAKARVNIPTDGPWTFGVHSDDGVAFRIDGGVFTSVSGDSWIDPADTSALYFRFGTGDSNIRAICNIAAGEHDIEFLYFEGTGGANFELYAANGSFVNDADSTNWHLVGDVASGGLELVAPVVPDSSFQVSSVSYNAAGAALTISFPSTAGAQYGVEWSSTLTSSPWASAGTVTGAAGSTSTTVYPATLNGGTAPQRFFVRVRQTN